MPDYTKGVIYKLCCKDVNISEIYVGSTINFKSRKDKHRQSCNNENNKGYNLSVYQYIRENGGFNNWDMILIESYPSENKRELEKRERYWMEELKASLNCVIPTRERKCEHQRSREFCVECKGSQICPHQRQRHRCVECEGSQICPHQRQRHRCVECEGSQICPHQRECHRCKECSPVICEICGKTYSKNYIKRHLQSHN
jgi:hypothetical protein